MRIYEYNIHNGLTYLERMKPFTSMDFTGMEVTKVGQPLKSKLTLQVSIRFTPPVIHELRSVMAEDDIIKVLNRSAMAVSEGMEDKFSLKLDNKEPVVHLLVSYYRRPCKEEGCDDNRSDTGELAKVRYGSDEKTVKRLFNSKSLINSESELYAKVYEGLAESFNRELDSHFYAQFYKDVDRLKARLSGAARRLYSWVDRYESEPISEPTGGAAVNEGC